MDRRWPMHGLTLLKGRWRLRRSTLWPNQFPIFCSFLFTRHKDLAHPNPAFRLLPPLHGSSAFPPLLPLLLNHWTDGQSSKLVHRWSPLEPIAWNFLERLSKPSFDKVSTTHFISRRQIVPDKSQRLQVVQSHSSVEVHEVVLTLLWVVKDNLR